MVEGIVIIDKVSLWCSDLSLSFAALNKCSLRSSSAKTTQIHSIF